MIDGPREPDLIDGYLDELASRLHGPPGRTRRILEEAEAHLRDAAEAAAAMAPGTDPVRSSAVHQQVLDGFGTPAQVAKAHNRALLRPRRLVGPFALLLGQLLSIGLIVVGFSGLVLAVLARTVGRTSMFADPVGTHFPAAACAHWLGLHPGAGSCARAYTLETANDAIAQRALAGILGLLVLAAVVLARRRRPEWTDSVIPRGATPALALVGFLPAALGLFGVGVDRVIVGSARGAGMWFADGSVSLIAAAACLVILVWSLLGGRTRSPLTGTRLR
jgi:hypothetical protein